MNKQFKQYEVIVYDPKYKGGTRILKKGEAVLFLGMVPNARGHCVVAKRDGAVVWLMHPEDFRKATEDEV